MPVKSLGFAIGNLRARENKLLKKSDLLQLSSAINTDDLADMMRNKGIGGANAGNLDVPQLLRKDTEELWKYLTENAPEMDFFAPFIYENDFHNYKAVLKAVVRGRNYENLLIVPAITEISAIERAVKEKRFELLPEYMRESAAEAYEVLAQTGDSQLADCIIDAGCMSAQLNKARETKNEIIVNLITVIVFYGNIKAALRAAKTGKSRIFVNSLLTETGVVPKNAMEQAAASGEEKLLELLNTAVKVGGAEAAEAYQHSFGAFEKYVDNRLMSTAKRCKYITMGIEPIIGYMLARQAEIKNLRIIYSGVKTGQPADKTRERLRELYD